MAHFGAGSCDNNHMSGKVLVTGLSGFIGRQTAPTLLARGFDVVGVGVDDPPPELDAAYETVDLMNARAVEDVLNRHRPTHLLHLAWTTSPGEYWTSPENLDWVAASLHLIRRFQSAGGRRVVVAGSCAEYDWGGEMCHEAHTPLRPATLYGVCKNSLRQVLGAFSRQTGLSHAWGRVFFLYGPHENPTRLVASVITHLLRGEEARTTHGGQLRDLLHVEDVAGGLVALLASEVEGAVNIASGEAVSLKKVTRTIARLLGREDLLLPGAIAAREEEPPQILADVTRLKHEVGFTPRFSLEDGLSETIDWWRGELGI